MVPDNFFPVLLVRFASRGQSGKTIMPSARKKALTTLVVLITLALMSQAVEPLEARWIRRFRDRFDANLGEH